jgi:hypothetical protein
MDVKFSHILSGKAPGPRKKEQKSAVYEASRVRIVKSDKVGKARLRRFFPGKSANNIARQASGHAHYRHTGAAMTRRKSKDSIILKHEGSRWENPVSK